MVFANFQLELILQVLLAAILGIFVGLEREYNKKEAGMRTFGLISLGSCLFTILGLGFKGIGEYPLVQLDLTRIVQAVAIGIGFIGAGSIIFRKAQIEGLTTAACMWVTAGIGLAVGVKFYFLAVLVTIVAILILALVRLAEDRFFPKIDDK
jgi:putative Mg2+ transporter-C (MgtC) family protein